MPHLHGGREVAVEVEVVVVDEAVEDLRRAGLVIPAPSHRAGKKKRGEGSGRKRGKTG